MCRAPSRCGTAVGIVIITGGIIAGIAATIIVIMGGAGNGASYKRPASRRRPFAFRPVDRIWADP